MRKLVGVLTLLSVSVLAYQNCGMDFVVARFDDNLSSLGEVQKNSQKLRRLSNQEYRQTLYDILTMQFTAKSGSADPNWYWYPGEVQGPLSELPAEQLASKLGTDQISTNLSSARFTAYIDTAYAVGKHITAYDFMLRSFTGGCASVDTTMDAACIEQFITDFAALAFRKPPTSDERAELKKNSPNWHTLIAKILLHPRFLLHFDREGTKDANGNYLLTDYEIESRLAAIFWKSAPDQTGLAAAQQGKLKTPAGFQAELKRILDSQKSHDALWIFYQQWLAASRLPIGGYYNSGWGWAGFAAPLTDAQVNNNLKQAALTDAQQFLEYLTWTSPANLETIFRSPLIFTTDATLAGIYGVTPRANATAAPVSDSTGHYRGILTRAMVTQQKPSTNGDVNHIQRGVFILTNLLNMELGQPANFADQQQAQLNIPATASTRTEVQTKTGQGSCIGCHSTINPAGYGLANYDSLGRYMTTENRFRDNNANGSVQVASNAVDASSTLPLSGVAYPVNDASSLVDAMFRSGRIYQGFANYYFEYAFGRVPTTATDKKSSTPSSQVSRPKQCAELSKTWRRCLSFRWP